MVRLVTKVLNRFNDSVFVLQYYQILRYVVSFVVSIIMVRSSLPAEDLGHYELFLFIVTSVTTFWSVGIKNAMFSWFGTLNDDDKKSFPALAFITLLLVSIFIGLILGVLSAQIFPLFSAQKILGYWPYLALYIVLSVPLIITESLLFLQNETTRLLHYAHWSHFGLLFLTIAVALLSPLLDSFIYLLIIWSFIRMLYLLYLLMPSFCITVSWSVAFSFFIFSLPLILNMFLGSAMDIIDGLFVTYYFEPSFFPVFKYGARELPLSGLLFSTLSVAMIPTIIEKGSSTFALRDRATRIMHWLFPVSLGLMLISPFLFPLVYNENFESSAHIFNIYLLIISSRVLMPQSFSLALHQHKIIIWSGIVEIVINIALSFWWVQIWGVFGLAMATVVAYFFQKVILIIYNYKKYKITLGQYIDVRYYLIYMSILIITFVLSYNFFR